MCSLDHGVYQGAAELLKVRGDYSSGPVLSCVRGLNSKLKPDNNILPLSPYSQTIYTENKAAQFIVLLHFQIAHASGMSNTIRSIHVDCFLSEQITTCLHQMRHLTFKKCDSGCIWGGDSFKFLIHIYIRYREENIC